MNKKLLVAGLALALTACGTPKKSPDANGNGIGGTNQGQGTPGTHISLQDFQAKCAAKATASSTPFATPDNNFCIVPTSASIPDGFAASGKPTLVDSGFHAGKYIVSHGTTGSAVLVLGLTTVSKDINYRGFGLLQSGTLSIQVLHSESSKADVTTYDCFDYNVNPVYCNDGIIP